jgi:hypothetical protein
MGISRGSVSTIEAGAKYFISVDDKLCSEVVYVEA